MSKDLFYQLQADIQASAGLHHQAATGFYETYCPVCSYTKRKTGGFRFDAEQIIFNCFRASCDASCVYDLEQPVSRKFRHLMDVIGVRIPPELRAKKNSIQQQIQRDLDAELYVENRYRPIQVPKNWTPLRPSRDVDLARYYRERACDPSQVYVIRHGPKRGLSAVPMYFYDMLIGFQIVDPDGLVKYQQYTDGNENMLLINGGIIRSPVILVEGVLDAFCFPHAVANLSSRISPEKAYHLRGKEVIVFPDRTGGEDFLKAMHVYGWKAYIPPTREVKDLNDMVRKYGKVSTARMIKENTIEDHRKASVAFTFWTG